MLRKTIVWLMHVQDIVTAHEHFNMDGFVGQFQTALQVTSPKKRMFLLDWMGVRPYHPPVHLRKGSNAVRL